jgi:Kef-type K+ transport system membrane component KefB
MLKNALIYGFVIVFFGLGIYMIVTAGSRLMPVAAAANERGSLIQHGGQASNKGLLENLGQPLSLLLVQIIVITLAARGLGRVFAKMGQPAVIGEMLAGILLGPSLLGWMMPQAGAFLFPANAMGSLQLLSQVGVILFMFIVGTELNLGSLRHQAHSAMLISHAGILVPFILGTGFSLLVYPSVGPAGIPFHAFALFMGIAMSITAFPVLARIIEQRGLSGSPLGNLAIACAAVDDVTAWCLLAVVLSLTQSNGLIGSALTVGMAILFIGVMLFVIRPWLRRTMENRHPGESGKKVLIANMLIFAFASALFTEAIGIHALFGAFLAGVTLPPPKVLRVQISEHLETFTAFLLPLFFAFTGLRTQIGLLNDGQSWLLCLAIIAVAIAGKLGGAALAARSTGLSWHDSLSVGALMNTRGLMELIVINIGYDLGILSARVFVMMVLMALTTTIMTGPILSLLKHWQLQNETNKMSVKL